MNFAQGTDAGGIHSQDSQHLLAQFVNGDDRAATAIYDKYVERLIRLAQSRLSPLLNQRVDAEDIVQSAYRSFFRRAQENEISLKRNGDLWRVLAAFTLNKTRSHLERELAEKRDPRRESPNQFWQLAIQREPSPDEACELIDQVKAFMARMNTRDRAIFECRLKGDSIEEIACELAKPSAESGLKPQQVSLATIRRVLRESKRLLEESIVKS